MCEPRVLPLVFSLAGYSSQLLLPHLRAILALIDARLSRLNTAGPIPPYPTAELASYSYFNLGRLAGTILRTRRTKGVHVPPFTAALKALLRSSRPAHPENALVTHLAVALDELPDVLQLLHQDHYLELPDVLADIDLPSLDDCHALFCLAETRHVERSVQSLLTSAVGEFRSLVLRVQHAGDDEDVDGMWLAHVDAMQQLLEEHVLDKLSHDHTRDAFIRETQLDLPSRVFPATVTELRFAVEHSPRWVALACRLGHLDAQLVDTAKLLQWVLAMPKPNADVVQHLLQVGASYEPTSVQRYELHGLPLYVDVRVPAVVEFMWASPDLVRPSVDALEITRMLCTDVHDVFLSALVLAPHVLCDDDAALLHLLLDLGLSLHEPVPVTSPHGEDVLLPFHLAAASGLAELVQVVHDTAACDVWQASPSLHLTPLGTATSTAAAALLLSLHPAPQQLLETSLHVLSVDRPLSFVEELITRFPDSVHALLSMPAPLLNETPVATLFSCPTYNSSSVLAALLNLAQPPNSPPFPPQPPLADIVALLTKHRDALPACAVAGSPSLLDKALEWVASDPRVSNVWIMEPITHLLQRMEGDQEPVHPPSSSAAAVHWRSRGWQWLPLHDECFFVPATASTGLIRPQLHDDGTSLSINDTPYCVEFIDQDDMHWRVACALSPPVEHLAVLSQATAALGDLPAAGVLTPGQSLTQQFWPLLQQLASGSTYTISYEPALLPRDCSIIDADPTTMAHYEREHTELVLLKARDVLDAERVDFFVDLLQAQLAHCPHDLTAIRFAQVAAASEVSYAFAQSAKPDPPPARVWDELHNFDIVRPFIVCLRMAHDSPYYVLDGHHKLEAYMRVQRLPIPVVLIQHVDYNFDTRRDLHVGHLLRTADPTAAPAVVDALEVYEHSRSLLKSRPPVRSKWFKARRG